MDQIDKALQKLTLRERVILEKLLDQIGRGLLIGLDVKKLVGSESMFRVRKGTLRILFTKLPDSEIRILRLERRSTTTYRRR